MEYLKRGTKTGIFRLFASEIRIEQTFFALPFVFTGSLMGSNFSLSLQQILLIVVALASARALGMLLNRIIDRTIDRLNPRTKGRHLASGKLTLRSAYTLAALCLALYILSAFLLGPLPLKLSWIPLLLFVFYPYTKRFTWLCHFFLGITLGLAPLAGWFAVSENISAVPFILTIAVATWVSGFDIFYATMDLDFDRQKGLHSLPARFGLKVSSIATLSLHFLTAIFLILAGVLYGFHTPYFIVLSFALLFLFYNDITHLKLLATARINDYLQRNSFFSLIVFASVLIDFLIGKAG
jgi:4-hydroxybenzoate polyprenyltransferase